MTGVEDCDGVPARLAVDVGEETDAVANGEGGARERLGVGERLGLDDEERVALGLTVTLRLGEADWGATGEAMKPASSKTENESGPPLRISEARGGGGD